MEAQVPKRRFSWINLAILLFCCGIVLSLIAPGPGGHRPARRMESINNLKNLALAIHNSSAAHRGMLPHPASHSPPLSWRVEVLKFLDRADLSREYSASLTWDDEKNAKVSRTPIKYYQSPIGDHWFFGKRDPLNPAGWPRCDYGMVSGPGTVNPDDGAIALDDVSEGDGLGQTLLVVECSGLQLAWAEPRDPHLDHQQIGIERVTGWKPASNALISTWSSVSAPVVFADGAARGLSLRTDPKVLQALCTVNGKEQVDERDYLP